METIANYKHPANFWDRIAPKYAKQPIQDMSSYEEKIDTVKALLKPNDRVLEIGCGTGGTAMLLAPFVSEVIGTDISRGMIEIADSKLSTDKASNVRFLQAGADARVSDQPFDTVCAFSLLHLVDDIPLVLKNVREQLKPGGLFISKTVCLKEGTVIVRGLVRVLTALGFAPRVSAISRSELMTLIKEAGFEIETTLVFGKQRTNPFIVARRL